MVYNANTLANWLKNGSEIGEVGSENYFEDMNIIDINQILTVYKIIVVCFMFWNLFKLFQVTLNIWMIIAVLKVVY